jgi:hypothetical protein
MIHVLLSLPPNMTTLHRRYHSVSLIILSQDVSTAIISMEEWVVERLCLTSVNGD